LAEESATTNNLPSAYPKLFDDFEESTPDLNFLATLDLPGFSKGLPFKESIQPFLSPKMDESSLTTPLMYPKKTANELKAADVAKKRLPFKTTLSTLTPLTELDFAALLQGGKLPPSFVENWLLPKTAAPFKNTFEAKKTTTSDIFGLSVQQVKLVTYDPRFILCKEKFKIEYI